MIIWTLTTCTALIVLAFTLSIAVFRRRIPVLHPAAAPAATVPLISVIVPARNEAEQIERCVRSILALNYPHVQVIAVDDASTDATPQILARLAQEDARLLVVTGRPLAKGWTGKNNAVFSGVQHAHGAWLLFVDADVVLHPGALSAAYAEAKRRGVVLLTLWARQELVTFWERVVQPVIIGLNQATDPFQWVSSPRFPMFAYANGQFILVERAAYEQIGGHTRVRDQVVEDQKLSWHFKHARHSIVMMDGTRVLSTRMYTSLTGIWEGWSKNNFLMLDRNFVLVLLTLTLICGITISPFFLTLWALLIFKSSHSLLDPLIVNLVCCVLVLATRWQMRSYFPTTFRDCLLYPLGGAVFIGIVLNSAYRHSQRRGVTWKGRRYGDADAVG